MLGSINKIYNVGIYIRLSREDDDKALESESITNQKSLLLQYVKENNLRVYDIYIDDGYSGTNFDRPDFNRLLNDIELGRVNMVITKDMSRLGRDYIGTGNLIEKYFPEHNVRYIAVTDNIDTFLDNSNNDIAPFKAIMNDMYAKDISKKIKSSLRAKQKEGKWVGGRTPFGYDQDPNDKNHLVINEEQALVVKRIFDMCLEGLSFFKIAKQLTNEGVKTPAGYYSFEWKSNYNLKYGEWHSKTIRDILTNRMYIGDMVQNRRSKVNYKVKKVIKNNPKDYIIVENTHEAIIDKETFYEVQKRIPKNVGRNEKKENHLLDGLLYCGDCGHRISIQSRRKKDNRCYTICNYYRTYMKQRLCTTHSNNYDELEKVIIKSLTNMCLSYINKDKVRNNVLNNLTEDNEFNNKKELEILINDIKQINDNLDIIYIDKLNKKITEEQFERVKIKLEWELNIKQKRYNELNNSINDNINEESKNKLIIEYINKFLSMKKPSRELIINLIDRIEIFEDKNINIKVTFNDNSVLYKFKVTKLNYINLLKEIDALKEKNNKIYKQNYIMFIPLSYKTIKENEYDEKMVQYDIENVIEEFCYKEKKTIFFINKFLEVFKQIIILDKKLFSEKNICFSPNQYYQELTYYFDSIVASFSTIIESEQRIVLEEYFGQKEINNNFPTRNKFGLYWQIYMLRNRILHFTGKRYSYDNKYCSCYQDFSSQIKIIRIDEKGNINIPSTLLDIYIDENIKRGLILQ